MSVRLFCFPAVESAGEITQATLPTWRAAQSFRHHSFSLSSPAQLPRGIIHGDFAKMVHRAGFSSVPGSSGNSGYGGSQKSSSISISSRASRFARLRGGARRKKNRGDASEMPLRSLSSPMFVSPAWKVDSGGARRQSRLRRDSDVAHAACRAWPPSVLMGGKRRETIGGHSPQDGAALGHFALLCFFRMGGQLRRKNNSGDTASVKRGRLASPLSVFFFRPARSTPAGKYP